MIENFCCEVFNSKLELSDLKGISIRKTSSKDAPFELYFSAVDKRLEKSFIEEMTRTQFSVGHCISGSVRIKYCPWCGTKLSG